ncbi:hypothetical protein ACFUJ0_07195 [Streptomyces sp. NPDC057242]|uniref:hypothetical protein n=1 Tax=unclassified Streptomyces TaxID=2593676 RepID=UPI0036447F78
MRHGRGVEGAQTVYPADARCVIARGEGFWLLTVQGQGELCAVAAGGLERLQDVLGGVEGGAPAVHARTVVAVCAQGAAAVPRRLPDAARLIHVLEPTREADLKSLDFAAAPGPGQQARRGAEHTRQEPFVERMLCAPAMPFVQELACLVDAARDLLDCVAKFVAVEVPLDGVRRMPARLTDPQDARDAAAQMVTELARDFHDIDVEVSWNPPQEPWSWTAQIALAVGTKPAALDAEG